MASHEKVVFDGAVTIPVDGFCDCRNLWVLWRGPAARGVNRLISHKSGRKPYSRKVDERRAVLDLPIYGLRAQDGSAHADVRSGLLANIDFLRTYFDPLEAGDGTRTAALHLPDGTTRSGPVIVEDFDFEGNGPTSVIAALELTLPTGVLVP